MSNYMSEAQALSEIYDEYPEKTEIISSKTVLDKAIKEVLIKLGFKYKGIPQRCWTKIVSDDVKIGFYYRKNLKHPYAIAIHDYRSNCNFMKFQKGTKVTTIIKWLNRSVGRNENIKEGTE